MIVKNGYKKYGFDAYGGSVLKAEHMAFWMDKPQRVDSKGISFELGKEVEEVEADFFSLVPTIKELFILNPSCNVIMTEATITQFQKNQVLIRGCFDTAAEQFAKKYGLHFLHIDVELAVRGDYYKREGVDVIVLCFHRDGNAYVSHQNFCEGASGGWCGGGEINFDLPQNFYMDMDLDAVAEACSRKYYEELKSNGRLSELLQKAKAKGGFLIDYHQYND